MRSAGIGLLAAVVGSCSDPTPPETAIPALEGVPYALLGTGKIAFERITADYHAVYLIDPVAQTSTVIGSGVFNGPSLSPDGQQLAVTQPVDLTGADIVAHGTDGSNRRHLSVYPGDEGVPSWTPDGLGLTFLRSSGSLEKVITELRASDGVPQRTITLKRADACSVFYAGDAEDRVEVSSTGQIATPCAPNSLTILSKDGVRAGNYSNFTSLIIGFGWSSDGSKLAVMEMTGGGAGNTPSSQTLRITSADGSSPRVVFTMPLTLTQNGRYSGANDSAVCWLKGVDRLLVAVFNESRRFSQLWVVNEDGTGLTKITTAIQATDRSISCGR